MASEDHLCNFHFSGTLYGREHQIAILRKTFEETAPGSPRMMLVSGHSGVGKSTLIHEVYKTAREQQGFFISGKFDQFNNDIPFSALIQAFNELVGELLTKSDKEQAAWKDLIVEAVGQNGQIITAVIPALEQIIGVQPEVAELGPVETQNRFRIYFQRFINVFTNREHLFTIFLDDLQWADYASLNLIKTIMADHDTKNLLFLGAFRDNETKTLNSLLLTIYTLEKEQVPVTILNLQPLNLDTVTMLIADFLECSKMKDNKEGEERGSKEGNKKNKKKTIEEIEELSRLVFNKTEGNPFFVIEFLKSLCKQDLLIFDNSGEWQWDIENIKILNVTSNVAEFLAEKVGKIRPETRELLNSAACIGNRFSLTELVIVTGTSREDAVDRLAFAVEDNFILLQDETYSFSHDKIQEAVYSLIPEDEKNNYHHRIGKSLLENSSPEEIDRNIFHITDQLNAARDRIRTLEERAGLAGLNLKAGKRAKNSTAYRTALGYLQKGIGLIRDRWWSEKYELTFSLYKEGAEAAYLSTDFELMEQLARTGLKNSRDLPDQVKIYKIKINAYASRAEHIKTIKTGCEILEKLNVNIPKKVTMAHVVIELLKTKLRFFGKNNEKLLNMPDMTDRDKASAMAILMSIGPSAYYSLPIMLPIIIFKMIKLTLKYGSSPFASFAYAGVGFIFCGILNDIESGYRFGSLALDVFFEHKRKELEATVKMMVFFLIKHWKCHLKEVLAPLVDGYKAGLEAGDFQYASLCIHCYINCSIFSSIERETVYKEAKKFLAVVEKLKQKKAIIGFKQNCQFLSNLMGHNSKNRHRLHGDIFDEDRMLPILKKDNDDTDVGGEYIYNLMLCYLFGHYGEALENAENAKQYLDSLAATLYVLNHNFYYSLSLLVHYSGRPKREQKKYLKQVRKNQKMMKKWAHHAPMNHLHKYYLVKAEIMQVLKQLPKAEDLYEKAIHLAGENDYIHEQAICYECAGKFYLEQNNPQKAKEYIQNSKNGFEKWGALEKVNHLNQHYRELLNSP